MTPLNNNRNISTVVAAAWASGIAFATAAEMYVPVGNVGDNKRRERGLII